MQLNAECNLTIHPNFVGYHKCGYANCPVCKTAVTNSGYWYHIRSHPGHENDSPPQRRMSSNFDNRRKINMVQSIAVLIKIKHTEFFKP